MTFRPSLLYIPLFFVYHGASVNIVGHEGNTAILYAATRGNVDIIITLLHYGASLEDKNDEGKTVLTIAEEQDFIEELYLLKRNTKSKRAN